MKHLFASLTLLTAIALATTSYSADGLKIATIDLRKVAQQSKAGAEATKELSIFAEKLESSLKKKQAELEKIKDALEGKGKKLTDKERAAKEKEIKQKLDKYRELAQNAQKDLQAKESEHEQKIGKGIEKTVKEYSAKNGYALVIRKGDTAYTDEKIIPDISDDILKLFDAALPEEAEKK
jgi:outer membrane protein